MTLEELINKLTSLRRNGRISDESTVYLRDLSITDDMIDAGSRPWVDLEEILVVDGDVYLGVY